MEKIQIEKTYEINASIGEVWDALVNPEVIEKWSGSPAEMSDEKDYEFSLWDGDIYGVNTLVEEPELIEQDWYGGDWDEPSKVRIELAEEDGATTVTLTHGDIPQDDIETFIEGWDDYYFGAIQEMFE